MAAGLITDLGDNRIALARFDSGALVLTIIQAEPGQETHGVTIGGSVSVRALANFCNRALEAADKEPF